MAHGCGAPYLMGLCLVQVQKWIYGRGDVSWAV